MILHIYVVISSMMLIKVPYFRYLTLGYLQNAEAHFCGAHANILSFIT